MQIRLQEPMSQQLPDYCQEQIENLRNRNMCNFYNKY